MGRANSMKIVRAIEMAVDSNAPFIALYSSGGARVEEGIIALEGLGAVLAALSDAKGAIPLITAVLGPCPGGLAIAAAKSDFIFMVNKLSGLFVNSPMLSVISDAQSASPDDIGTAGMHKKTGLASFISDTETECFSKIRELLGYVPVVSDGGACAYRAAVSGDDPNRTSEALDKMATESDIQPISAAKVFTEISDNNKVMLIGSDYGSDMTVGLGRMDGLVVGFIGNETLRMSPQGVRKAAKFVRFCDDFMIPLVTLTNSEGFELGYKTEISGILDDASALVEAFACADVPRVAILAGKAIGTAYLCMNSKMIGADTVFAWPTAEISILSADTAAHILYREKIAGSEDPITARAQLVEEYKNQIADARVAASLGQVDELIAPSATRPRVISALDILLCAYPLSET
jgi:acetyl-CoA carboxylase carboxyltransferase component